MADWDKFTGTGDAYASIPGYEDGKDDDAVTLNDTRRAAATNLPDYAKRWNNALSVFQNWLSSAWSTLILAISGGGTGASTAAGARSNLSVPSINDMNTQIDADVATHAAIQSAGVHGGTSANTANKLVQRDSAGRFKASDPSAAQDVATKNYVDTGIPSGTYSPTLTQLSGPTPTLVGSAMYHRIGNLVSVALRFTMSAATGGQLGVSLPIASDLASITDLIGDGTAYAVDGYIWAEADTANNRAKVYVTGSGTYLLRFTYRVL